MTYVKSKWQLEIDRDVSERLAKRLPELSMAASRSTEHDLAYGAVTLVLGISVLMFCLCPHASLQHSAYLLTGIGLLPAGTITVERAIRKRRRIRRLRAPRGCRAPDSGSRRKIISIGHITRKISE